MLWVNNPFEEMWKRYFMLMIGLQYLKYIKLTVVANNPSKMYSTNPIKAYFFLVEWTVGNYSEALPFSRFGCCSLEVFSFLPPIGRNAQDMSVGSFHRPSLGVAHHFHVLLSQLDLRHTEAPPSRRGWHHILSVQEEEESMDFIEKPAVSAAWSIIKQ